MGVSNSATGTKAGVWYSVAAYTAWGILPLYWKLLVAVPAQEILAHRIFWSFIFTASLLFFAGKGPLLRRALKDKRKLAVILLSGFLISFNWYTYIWAVNANHVIQASMGYYMNPLVVVLLGVTVFKEKLTRWQIIGIILASIGVGIMTFNYGQIPWVSLVLATSFALYGLVKKLIVVDSITGLALETLAVMPIALFYIISKESQGSGTLLSAPVTTTLILAGTGVVTALPLLFFAQGAQRIKLSMVGFLQYIAPTISLILGIFVFQETFSRSHLVGFGFIWMALLIFTLSNFDVLPTLGKSKPASQIVQPKPLNPS